MGAPFTPDQVRVSLLREQVADVVRRALVDLRLEPGQRLVERELMQWTGVSRATIREAIRQLAAEGLVTTVPQKGALVAILTPEEAAELFEVRAVLEGMVARRFVERANNEHRGALVDAFRGLVHLSENEATTWEMLRAKERFYETLFAGAGNTSISEVLRAVQARTTLLRAGSLSRPARLQSSVEEIGRIVEAVDRCDPLDAERASIDHVRSAQRAALGALDGVTDFELQRGEIAD